MAKFSRTSVQLPADLLNWLGGWPVTRSEALRLNLERAQYLQTQMGHVQDLALKYHPILTPALAEFTCQNFRAVARALDAIVEGFTREKDYDSRDWKDENGKVLDLKELIAALGKLSPVERIYLLDRIVARRESMVCASV